MTSTTNYVIFDTNGSSDDAWALALLLKADSLNKIKLLAITAAPGPIKTEAVARNIQKVLRAKQRDDIPVYLGAATRFMPHGYDTHFEHERDSRHDVHEHHDHAHHDHHDHHAHHEHHDHHDHHDHHAHHEHHDHHSHHEHHDNHGHSHNGHHHFRSQPRDAFDEILPQDFLGERAIQTKHAVRAIRDLVYQYPNLVTIISTGPLTNVALAYAMFGTPFAPLVKALYIMGGAYQAVGNITRDAEFNFHLDPEAAHIVLARAKSPITILPWEACTKERFQISADWRFDVLGANQQDEFIALMNRMEKHLLGKPRDADWIPYDAMIVAVFLFNIHFVSVSSPWNARVELFGKFTRGEMIIDHLKNLVKNPINATIVENVSDAMFKMIAMWAAGYASADSTYIEGLL